MAAFGQLKESSRALSKRRFTCYILCSWWGGCVTLVIHFPFFFRGFDSFVFMFPLRRDADCNNRYNDLTTVLGLS